MIPASITKEHILQALRDIDAHGVPSGRRATRYALEYESRLYPPKLVVSVAAKYALGAELDPATFSGGQETNQFLRRRGFRIVGIRPEVCPDANKARNSAQPNEPWTSHKGERCPACKVRVRQLLESLYGRVEERYSLRLGVRPEDYEGKPYRDILEAIHARLVAFRGFTDFIRARQLPPCDYFVPDTAFILEFDESQHFTAPRNITLESYPSTLQIGFDRQRWRTLCQEIGARDHDPPFRDEQRAWYDTLRDFAPVSLGLRPTVRLYAGYTEWCRLDPGAPTDVEWFRLLVEAQSHQLHVRVRADRDPLIARTIIKREWPGQVEQARALLESIIEQWPHGPRVEFLLTCGGFIQYPLSEAVPLALLHEDRDAVLKAVLERAVQVAYEVVSSDLRDRLRERTRRITLGIDTYKSLISTTHNRISEPHAETVVVLDLDSGLSHVTAKSYPTTAQERGLLRCKDLESHFLDLNDGTCVLVLGCHDLSVWNPRSINAGGWREEVNAAFRRLACAKRPKIVLHHPHTTDHKMTWRAAWKTIERELPSVEFYAGAGRYWGQGRQRSPLDETLALTKKGPTLDFIVG